jgi:8-amino-7-oxononanoate synthase
MAPPVAAAARAALTVIREEPGRRERLLALAERLRDGLRALGHDVGGSCCHIVPVLVGGAREAVALSARLEEYGLLVPAIRPPSVPEGTARLRISLTTGHTEADVDRLLTALRRLRGAPMPRCRTGEGSA